MKKSKTREWKEIEIATLPPNKFVWLYGYQVGKDVVGPFLGYYDPEDDFYYDEYGLGHAWMTHWREVLKPVPPQLDTE